jgi:hypothetical protein
VSTPAEKCRLVLSESVFRIDVEILWNISAISPNSFETVAAPPDLPNHLAPPRGTQLFAILDASLFYWASERISSSGLPHSCLFDPGPDGELLAHAPWLVQLDLEGSLARNLMTQGDAPWTTWGRPGVVFIHSHQSIAQLRQHFRRVLYLPRADGGSRVFLRFWLAEILHDLCQNASEEWCAPHRLFGPEGEVPIVDRFLAAWEGGRSLLIASAPKQSGCGRLVYDARLEEVLRGTMRRRFAVEMMQHNAPRFLALDQIARDTQEAAFLEVMDQGKRLGLTQRGPLIVWSEASLLLGMFAIDDHSVRPILHDSLSDARSQMQAAERLHLGLQQHLQNCAGGPGHPILKRALDRVDNVLNQPPEGMANALNRIWPERVAAMGPQAFDAFLRQVDMQLKAIGEVSLVTRCAYGILCLFLGVGFQHDPFRITGMLTLFSFNSRHSDTKVIERMQLWKVRYFDELGAIA